MKKLIIIMVLAAILGGAKAYLDHQLHLKLDKTIATNKIKAEYSKISSSLLGQVIIEDLRLNNFVQIDKVILSKAYQFYDKLPESMDLNLEGVQISLDNTNKSVPMLIYVLGYAPYYTNLKELSALGYSNLRADVSLNAKLQNKKLLLSGTVEANKWGNFDILAELNNVSKSSIKRTKLVSSQLKYFNKGLVNKVTDYLANRNKITSVQLQQNFITKLENDIKQTDITNNIQQFIKNPQVLTAYLKPKIPISVNNLIMLPLLKFELKITAEQSIRSQ
ncbi:MAG: hypothetical protein KAG43_03470 [Candidatus Marithrix sp.]|nr:hypothetical protein [Candidatus Marithrix sp.]